MLSLSLVRSLVLRDDGDRRNSLRKAVLYLPKQPKWRSRSRKLSLSMGNGRDFPYLVFVPTEEVVKDELRVAEIARDVGMEFCGDLINGRLIYSWPGMAARESVWLPFPHLTDACPQQLHEFVTLSRGLFRVENLPSNNRSPVAYPRKSSLAVRISREFVDSMEKFTRILAGRGWSVFNVTSSVDKEVFVYRKIDYKLRLQWDGLNPTPSPAYRARELRLPRLDLTNARTEVLEYILLMTDDLFYLTQNKPPVNSSRRSFSSY
ncbi:uncharacterized protein LOC131043087 [Cryptomeria japonica]|uniref:uncharacterized protein LOC131043087 n=1 Tax=Cryptomeria japonica TaxID=3369 RepID=UPI0025ABEA33|nr:uncharacterized protein LOC131043087 [Cryptomeria japonica]